MGLFFFLHHITHTVSAQSAKQEINRLTDILGGIYEIFTILIIIAVTLAFLFLIWGVVSFLVGVGRGETNLAAEAKNKLFWGVLALFVLTSIWGLVSFLGTLLLGTNPGSRGSTDISTIRIPEGSGRVSGDKDRDFGGVYTNPKIPAVVTDEIHKEDCGRTPEPEWCDWVLSADAHEHGPNTHVHTEANVPVAVGIPVGTNLPSADYIPSAVNVYVGREIPGLSYTVHKPHIHIQE